MNNKVCKQFHERTYKQYGFKAQRLYPNEELLRFVGRNFFNLSQAKRKQIKILETGCGSGANLWMIAKEGFDAYGIDISKEGIKLAKKMMTHWQTKAHLTVGDIIQLPYQENQFDAVCDVLASFCLNLEKFNLYLDQVHKVLKPGGKFFSYTPGTKSDTFIKYKPSTKIDKYTLNGIKRKTAPFYGQNFPFRFTSVDNYTKLLIKHGFEVTYSETIMRTYRNHKEKFELITITAQKI